MSEPKPSARQAKKAERDAARRLGGRKARKLAEDEIPNLPGQEELDEHIPKQPEPTSDTTTNTKKSKKRKHDDVDEASEAAPATSVDPGSVNDRPKAKRAKKTSSDADKKNGDAPAKSRFIVFIGNLPYSATDASIRAHFVKLEPFTMRHRTDPKTKKSKGFAFLEFENYDRMKTCLKLYHHSIFDPEDQANGGKGKGNGKGGRRINVELTAGGGGKTEGRKEKIRVKNQRLDEQRQRRAEQEAKTEERKAKKGTKTDKVRVGEDQSVAMENAGIHPSRLAQVNG